MREALNRSLVLAIYLAWGQVSCAEGTATDVVGPDAALDAPGGDGDEAAPDVANPDVTLPDDGFPDVANPDVANPDVANPDVANPRDVPLPVDVPRTDAGSLPDSLPTEAVMLFRETACPPGWQPYTDAAGRALAVAANPALNGYRLGTQLADRENRGHAHSFGGSFNLEDVSYVGIGSGGNNGLSPVGTLRYRAQTSLDSAELPYVQLLVCRKTGPRIPRAQALPAGMMIFFTGPRCPEGYSQPLATRGRVMVGLPAGGLNLAPFGATAPLGADNPAQHVHTVTADLVTMPRGIALASGCCGSGYARNTTYRETARTEANEPGMPTIQLLQCQKD